MNFYRISLSTLMILTLFVIVSCGKGKGEDDNKHTVTGSLHRLEIVSKMDLYNDDSYYKFVSPDVPFEDISYEPDDLIILQANHISTSREILLRREALDYLQAMSDDFYEQFGVPLQVVSAYRSYDYQVGIKNSGCSDVFCAKPGHSEHQSGLAVDLFETSTASQFLANEKYKLYFERLQEHAHTYGFHNSYQYGREIDGYEREPWHRRFVGVGFATYLKNHNQTFSQFIHQPTIENEI